jgi:hypothetical protein
MSKQEQLEALVNAVMEGVKNGKMPLLTEEGFTKLGELMKESGRGFLVDFRSLKSDENVG